MRNDKPRIDAAAYVDAHSVNYSTGYTFRREAASCSIIFTVIQLNNHFKSIVRSERGCGWWNHNSKALRISSCARVSTSEI